MFFAPAELTLRKRARLAVPPPVPETGWRPPAYLPELRQANIISIDVETYEDDFDEGGPGWARGRGYVAGVSIAAMWANRERGKWYFPLRHEVEPEYNMDSNIVIPWLKEQLSTPIPKAGANLLYDIGWLTELGIYTQGMLYDVQFAEALIDEHAFVALETLASKYLGSGKTTSALYDWCAIAYGGKAGPNQRANIYRAPPRLVGPYAEDDADLPIDILAKQWGELTQQNLMFRFIQECKLIPLLIRMRRQGVRIDQNKAEQIYAKLGGEVARMEDQLTRDAGFAVNVDSGQDLARMFRSVGVQFPTTAPTARAPEGNPSFRQDWLKNHEHPLAKSVLNIRTTKKVQNTFIRGYLLERSVKGLIHCQFHPLKGDDNGAKTGRFASSDPNLQNIPSRTALGNRVRECFIAFANHLRWRKSDYSQIEYRMLAHYAVDDGDGSADKLRYTYINDPNADYHDIVQKLVQSLIGLFIERAPIKNINFGLMYGMAVKKLMRMLGKSEAECREIIDAYFSAATYVKPTMAAISREVQEYGYITTVTGRRCRFPLWEPSFGQRKPGLPYETALRSYGQFIKRAYDYRGTNYRMQGSAADVIKDAMVKCLDDGVFDVTGVPLLQVHDELDFSVISDLPEQIEAYREMTHILENTTQLRVPVRVDTKDGINWGVIG